MADQILFNVAADIITNLGSYAVQQIGLALGAEKELRKLEITMSTLKNVLLDAEEQQVTNRAVREWLQRLKEIVYEVDNLVDEFAYEALRRHVEIHGSKRREVRNFFSHTNPFVFGYNMGQKTKDVRERLDEIVADAKNFDFAIKVVEKHVQSRRRQETYSFVRSTEVVGRESDQKAIIQTLKSSSDEQSVHVIPIFGMGGLGKTTLAQSVYNDNWVANQFSQRIWVHVSEDFDIRGIVIKILNAVGDNECDKLAFQQLQNRLQQKLSERKFLLVLDDVWNEDRVEWIKLHDLLMAGVGGSMIIVTTRSNKVASIMGTCTPHILKGLSNDDCLSIFVRWAFNEGDDRKHQNLVNIGREIVKKCGGVPLAARTLGGLLYLKFDVHDWMLVRDSKIWAIVQNENDIMPVLRLSYDQMPSYLKQCFAYCSLFQKNEKIEKWRLIYLWMAQGFIQVSHHNEKLEDIGESYITELVNRSFLQEERQLGYYKMHDLVHDLAQYVSSGECFTINSTTEPNPERVRHAVLWLSLKDLEILKSMNLRTILRSGRSCSRYVQTIVSSFRYLRVLELNCFTGDVPSSIGELKHLRYLLIKADYGKITLPESISQLLNLQYLNLCTPWQHFFELPQGVGKLINLRCLSLNNIPLVGLPDEIGGLTILQRLRISGTKLKSLPEGIQHLSCLRYLEISRCNGLTSLLSGMQYLTSLEELIIRECCYLNFTKNDFQGLISLRSLTLYYLPKLISFPQRLQQSAATLEHIRIVFCPFLSSLSNCLEYLTSLRKLELCFCPSVMELPEKTKRLTELTILDGRTDWNLIKYFLEPFEGKNVSSAVNGFFLEYFSRRNARDINLKTKFFTRSAVTYNIE